MKNAADLIPAPTPEDTISFGDAFEVVYRALNPPIGKLLKND